MVVLRSHTRVKQGLAPYAPKSIRRYSEEEMATRPEYPRPKRPENPKRASTKVPKAFARPFAPNARFIPGILEVTPEPEKTTRKKAAPKKIATTKKTTKKAIKKTPAKKPPAKKSIPKKPSAKTATNIPRNAYAPTATPAHRAAREDTPASNASTSSRFSLRSQGPVTDGTDDGLTPQARKKTLAAGKSPLASKSPIAGKSPTAGKSPNVGSSRDPPTVTHRSYGKLAGLDEHGHAILKPHGVVGPWGRMSGGGRASAGGSGSGRGAMITSWNREVHIQRRSGVEETVERGKDWTWE